VCLKASPRIYEDYRLAGMTPFGFSIVPSATIEMVGKVQKRTGI
jgi:hypothetical protein